MKIRHMGALLAGAALLLCAPLAQAACFTPPTYGSLTGKDASSTTQTLQMFSGTNLVPLSLSQGLLTGGGISAIELDANCFLNVDIQAGSVALLAGSAKVGVVTTDQTTPGTTDLVHAAQSGNYNVGGLTGVGQVGSITRVANTTAYTGNQLICLFTSGTACAPIQVTIAGANGATGTLGRVMLEKSGSSTAGQFTIWLFSAAPTTTGLFDASAYVGPYAADITSGAYLGSLACTSGQATNDGTAQVFYECTPNVPQGWIQYQTLSGQTYVDALISVTNAYTPASGEVFKIVANSIRDK
jgi:hypothetical protein